MAAESPTLPELPRSLFIATMCGAGLKYEIASEVFDSILAEYLRSLYLQGWRNRGEVDARVCTRISRELIDEARPSFVASDKCASAIRSVADPKEKTNG